MIRLYEEQGHAILKFVEEWMSCVNFTWDDFHKPEHSGPVTDAILILKKQCEEGGGHEKDLIDTLVKLISTPSGKITSRQLTQIRKAILLPSEYNVLLEELEKRTTVCSFCEKELQRGELVTAIDANSSLCAACGAPDYICCVNGHIRAISPLLRKSLNKAMANCEACANEQEAAQRGQELYAEPPLVGQGRPFAMPIQVDEVGIAADQQVWQRNDDVPFRPAVANEPLIHLALQQTQMAALQREEVQQQIAQRMQAAREALWANPVAAHNVQNVNWDVPAPQNEVLGADEVEEMEDLLDEPEDEWDDA